jgi:hypothetical protein
MWCLVGVIDVEDVLEGDLVGLPFFVRDESVTTSW